MNSSTENTVFITKLASFSKGFISTLQNSPNPEIYYIIAAIAVIFMFYMIEKIFKIITFLFVAGAIVFGILRMQNTDLKKLASSVKSYYSSMYPAESDNEVTAKNVSIKDSATNSANNH